MKLCFFILYFTITKALEEWKSTQVLIKNGSEQTARDPLVGPIKMTPTFEMMIKHSFIWVDKSLIIREMWNSPGSVFIVTAPRRWGKTTIASMIGYYHELPLNEDGSEGDRTTSENYLYFTEGKIPGDPASRCDNKPLISTETSLNDDHLANHPVIYLSGNHLNIAEDFLDGFRSMIEDAYQRHYSLRMLLFTKSSIETDDVVKGKLLDDLKNFDKYHTNPETLNEDDLIYGISILSRLLKNTYQKDVVIIFDEYDGFICNTYFTGRHAGLPTLELETKFVNFLKSFMSETFKENKHVIKSIITGILPIVETTGLSGVNNVLLKYVFGEEDFFPFYGIFENEFYELANRRGVNQSLISRAIARYDGYRVLSHPNSPMFCIFSVTGFINSQVVENYWIKSGLTESLDKFFEHGDFMDDVATIMNTWQTDEFRVKIEYQHMLQLTLEDFRLIHSIVHKKVNYTSSDHRETIFSFLVSVGYFSVRATNDTRVGITIPNSEIFMDLKNRFLNSVRYVTNVHIPIDPSLMEYMKHNDSGKLQPLAQSVSKFLFDATQNSENYATVLSLAMGYFFHNSGFRAPLKNQKFFGNQDMLVFFTDDCKTVAVIVEPLYVHIDYPQLHFLLKTFRHCLSDVLFFQPDTNLDVSVVHFLAMTIHRNSTVELMSVGMSPEEVKEWNFEAAQYVEETGETEEKLIRYDVSNKMFSTLNETMPTRIWYARYDPN